MRNQIFTGIGCFARPDRLERIFDRIVRNYTLEPIKGIEPPETNLSKKIDGTHLLQTLMTDLSATDPSNGKRVGNLTNPKEITGFYLTLNDQKLNLSIFARVKNSRPKIYQTSLGELTRLRHKRLN
jgi:hypothetical protein